MDAGQAAVTLDSRVSSAQTRLNARELIDTLQALVRVRSVYDPARPDGNERQAADLVAGLLNDWDIPFSRRDVAPNRPNIVADIIGRRPGPLLILEGHTDVVTDGERSAWSIDPFAGEIRDGRLYGRGACDMKGGLTAMLFAARAIRDAGADFAGTLRLAILADEEGMMLGARAFVADGWLDGATAAIVCEPEGDRVCVAQKGSIRLRVNLTGRMAHGAMPDEGANPVAALGEILHACRLLEHEIQSRNQPHALLGRFHLTPTVALAGEPEQGNVIPAVASLFLDVRTAPPLVHPDLIARIEATITAAAGAIPGVAARVEVLDDRPATETDTLHPIVRAAVAAHVAETGQPPPFGGVPGSTDGTIFWAANRLPLVTWGPGATTLPHQADECVDLDDVVRYARMYVSAALRYFEMMERS